MDSKRHFREAEDALQEARDLLNGQPGQLAEAAVWVQMAAVHAQLAAVAQNAERSNPTWDNDWQGPVLPD
ncbi:MULTISPECIES: hypothetical protein [unclassified Streptomyces]|uniref:hypothetical protein n=1 Tax=unclassified Streptomyces TaxID=2593676 RepID=UPI001BE5492D|nr:MULTISPECIES: hypothetical protein [unclassified Streptomyces]MBT2406871.1 hypothetical protein [Streptomyces sp. ISL-21]MBT2613094.1 hypothetical protein [Streptomyces sp. ISL-87]